MAFGRIARRAFIAVLAGWLGLGGGPLRADEARPLEIAVLPFLSARLLVDTYEPLRAALASGLARPVSLTTAADFRTFAQRTQADRYPVVITAPHLARLAELEAGYRPMLQWKAPLRGVFLVDKDGAFHSVGDLRQRTIGTPDPLAVITMLGEETLAASGLKPGDDVRLVTLPSHNAAVMSLLRGEVAAALCAANALNAMAASLRDRIRPLAETAEMPTTLVVMAGPQLNPTDADALRDALLAFVHGEAGRSFLKRTGYGDVVPVAPGSLAAYDRFLPQTRRLLADARTGP